MVNGNETEKCMSETAEHNHRWCNNNEALSASRNRKVDSFGNERISHNIISTNEFYHPESQSATRCVLVQRIVKKSANLFRYMALCGGFII